MTIHYISLLTIMMISSPVHPVLRAHDKRGKSLFSVLSWFIHVDVSGQRQL